MARRFLFLQGPHGIFFPRLGDALRRRGHAVQRINFNGGDRATWPTGATFRGRAKGWPDFVARLIERDRISDIVLYGDNRPLHAAATAVARARGVRVHVFEEGYLRPDWVTLERGGVNGHSSLPRDPAWFREAAQRLPRVPAHPPLPSYRSVRGWGACFYHAQVVLQHWRFPLHRSHRIHNPVWEGIAHLRRRRRRQSEARRTAEARARLRGMRYFLFPLQLSADYQIRIHSPFASMNAAIADVLDSFAAHAPEETMLAVKEHPLDSGMTDWRAYVETHAAERGIAARVAFLEGGDLEQLIEESAGMVTINSTSGTLALAAGKPVKVLGTAIHDMPDLTDQQPLDHFWNVPVPPDLATYDAFCRVLVRCCLLHGAFLSAVGFDRLVEAAVERLEEGDSPLALGRS